MSRDKLEQLGNGIGVVESIQKGVLSVWESLGHGTIERTATLFGKSLTAIGPDIR